MRRSYSFVTFVYEHRPRINKFVFIGKDIDKALLKDEFQCCIFGTERHAKLREALEAQWEQEDEEGTQDDEEDGDYVP